MDWNKRTIPPKQPIQRPKGRYQYPSPPLMRFFGSIGFIMCGLLVFYLGQKLFGIDFNIWGTPTWNAKTVALFVVTLVAAIIGLLTGMGLGASIDIKSERSNHILNALWHYLANGGLIWLFLLTLCLTKIYGKEGFGNFAGETYNFAVVTAGIGIGGSLLTGLVLLVTGLLKDNSKLKLIPCLILSLPISMVMGYMQFRFLSIDSDYWIFMGIMLPVMLIPASAYMMSRDREQRSQLLD